MGQSLSWPSPVNTTMVPSLALLLSLTIPNIHTKQIRSAPRLITSESIFPHTPDLWKKGLCERVARQITQSQDGPPECQPVGSKVDCGCDEPHKYPVAGASAPCGSAAERPT